VASITKRGSGYRVQVRVKDPGTGEFRTVARTVKGSMRDAQRVANELESVKELGVLGSMHRIKLGAYLDEWLAGARPNLAYSTARGYGLNINRHIKPSLGQVGLTDLNPAMIRKLYAKLTAAGLKPRTVRYVHATLRRALAVALLDGLITRNPALGVLPPRIEPAEVTVLDEREAWRLLSAAQDSSIEPAVALALLCGLRRGEILGLRWGDVDLDRGTAIVRQTIQRQTGQGLVAQTVKTHRSRRMVELSGYVVAVLRKAKRAQAQSRLIAGPAWDDLDLITTTAHGTPLDPGELSATFRTVLGQAGLPLMRLHDLRHTHASHLLRAGVDIKTIQERLGHSSPAFTLEVYTHLLSGMQKEAAAAVEGLIIAAKDRLPKMDCSQIVAIFVPRERTDISIRRDHAI